MKISNRYLLRAWTVKYTYTYVYVCTGGPRLTRILGPERNRVRRNRTVGGLLDYTMQNLKKIALERS